jgi:hypothetical protein
MNTGSATDKNNLKKSIDDIQVCCRLVADSEWFRVETKQQNKMKLTALETEVLENLFDSADGNGHDFGYTEDHGIDPKQARGVISSLVQKNIIMVHEAITTDSGTWHQFTWVGKEPHEVNSIADILN